MVLDPDWNGLKSNLSDFIFCVTVRVILRDDGINSLVTLLVYLCFFFCYISYFLMDSWSVGHFVNLSPRQMMGIRFGIYLLNTGRFPVGTELD